MNPPTTLAAYAAGLAVVFAAALWLGSAVGPVGPVGATAPPPAAEQEHGGDAQHDDAMAHDAEGDHGGDVSTAELTATTTGGAA